MEGKIKTMEWLKSRFETGDIPAGEDYEDLLNSFWHKSEMGQVAAGDAQPVTGGAVAEAIVTALKGLDVAALVQEAVAAKLPTLLANYVTSEALLSALAGNASTAWVTEQLADKAGVQAVTDAIVDKVSMTALTEALAAKVDATAMAAALAEKADISELTTGLAGMAKASAVYTKQQIDAALASRPTQTEMAGEMSAAVADVPNSTEIVALRTALNQAIVRINKLSHVACGSDTMNVCMVDLGTVNEPTIP